MSETVDNRVVELQFNNSQFEKAVSESMKTLKDLNDSLLIPNAAKGFKALQEATENINFEKIQNGIERMSSQFSLFGQIANDAILRVVRAIEDKLMGVLNEFTMKPITDGFNEYELKMDSVQTIMAGSQKSMAEVNQYLQDLNTYSDKTIYSFKDMTSSIGKFTNAGVELGDAVAAIKGIANEAARSGANANEASRAMYNFSQALSTGSVKLIDWKSIENANMATVEFKQTLIDVAEAQGMLTKSGEGYIATSKATGQKMKENMTATKGFNDSLSAQWMTADVLTEALKIYANNVEDMTESERKAYHEALVEKYGEARAKEFEELGTAATGAATEVRTFSMMMDALKEAAGSGWATTMELVFGNFEQAKEMWTNVNNVLSGIVDGVSDARNNLLKGALGENVWSKDWLDVTKNVDNMDELIAKSKELGQQAGWDVDGLIERYGSFEKSLQAGWLTTDMFNQALKETGNTATETTGDMESLMSVVSDVIGGKFGNSDDRMRKIIDAGYDYATVQALVNAQLKGVDVTTGELTEEQIQQVAATEEQAEALRNLKKTADNADVSLGDALSLAKDLSEQKLSGREHMLGGISDLFFNLQKTFGAIRKGVEMAFEPLNAEKLYDILKGFHEWTSSLRMTDEQAEQLSKAIGGLLKPLNIIIKIVTAGLGFIVPKIGWLIKVVASILLPAIILFGDAIGFVYDNFSAIGNFIQKNLVDPIKDGIGKKATSVMERFNKTVEGARKYFASLKKILAPLGKIFSAIGSGLAMVAGGLAMIVMNSAVGTVLKGIASLIDGITNKVSGLLQRIRDFADYTGFLKEFVSMFKTFFNEEKRAFNEFISGERDISSYLSMAFGTLIGGFLPNRLKFLVDKFTNLKDVVKQVTGFFGTMRDRIGEFFYDIAGFDPFTAIYDKVYGLTQLLLPMANLELNSDPLRALMPIKDLIKTTFDEGAKEGATFAELIIGKAGDIYRSIEPIVKNVKGLLWPVGKILSNLIDNIRGFKGAIKITDSLSDSFKKFKSSVKDIFGKWIEKGGSIKTVFASIGIAFTTFKKNIIEAFKGVEGNEKLLDTLSKRVQIIKDQIKKLAPWLENTRAIAKKIFSNTKDAVSGSLRNLGKWLGDHIPGFKDLQKAVHSLGEGFRNFLKRIKDATSAAQPFGEKIKTVAGVIKDYILSLVDTIKHMKVVTTITTAVKNAFTKVYEAIKKFITVKLPEYLANAKKNLGGLWNSFKNSKFVVGLLESFKQAGEAIKEGRFLDYIKEKLKQLKEAFQDFMDFGAVSPSALGGKGSLLGLITSIGSSTDGAEKGVDKATGLFGKIKGLFSKIYDAIPGDTAQKKLVVFFVGIKSLISAITKLRAAASAVGLVGNLSSLFKSLGGLANAYKKNLKAEAFRNMGMGIALIAASLFVLSLIKWDRLLPAAFALALVVGAVGLVFYKLSSLGKAADEGTSAVAAINDALVPLADALKRMGTMIGLAVLAAGFGAAMLLVAVAISTFVGIPWEKAATGLVVAGVVAVALAGFLLLISKIGADLGGVGQLFAGIAASLIMFFVAVKMMAAMAADASLLRMAGVLIFGVIVLMGALVALTWLIKGDAETIKSLGETFLNIANSMLKLGLAIALLSKIKPTSMIVTVLAFAALIFVIAKSVQMIGDIEADRIKEAITGIVKVVKALKSMALIFGILGKISPGGTLAVTIGMIAMLGAIGLALYELSTRCKPKKLEAASKAIMKAAISVTILAAAAGALTFTNPGKLALAAGVILVLMGAMYLLLRGVSKIQNADDATKNILKLAATIAIIGVVVGVISRLDIGKVALAAGIIAVFAAVMVALTYAITKIKDSKNAVSMLLKLAAVIVMIGAVVAVLSILDMNKVIVAAVALGLLASLMVGLVYMISRMKNAAASAVVLVAISIALLILANALTKIIIAATMFMAVATAFVAMIAIVLGLLVVLCLLKDPLLMVGIAMTLIALSFIIAAKAFDMFVSVLPKLAAGLMSVAAALAAVGAIGFGKIAMGCLALIIPMAMLVVVMLVLTALALPMIAVGVAFTIMGTGMIVAAAGIGLLAVSISALCGSFEGFASIIDSIWRAISEKLSKIPVIGDAFKESADESTQSASKMASETQTQMTEANSNLQSGYDTMATTANTGGSNVKTAITDSFSFGAADGTSPLSSITGFFTDGTSGITSGFSDMTGAADAGGFDFKNALGGSFDISSITGGGEEGGGPMAGLSGLFGGGASDITAGFSQMTAAADTGGDDIGNALSSSLDFSDISSASGAAIPTDFASGISGNLGAANTSGQTIGTSAVDGINSMAGEFTTSGEESVKAFADGENNKKSKAEKKGKEVGKKAASAMDQSEKAKKSGGYMVDGFCNGIADKLWKVRQKAAEMAQTAINSANSKLDEQSPSKVFWQIGAYVTEGFANGISDKVIMADRASVLMAQSTIDRAAAMLTESNAFYDIGVGAIASLSAGLNADTLNYTPQITPVMNMGSAIASMNSLGAMRSNIDIGVDKLDTQWSKLNSIVDQLGDMHVTTDNSDVVMAINTMRQDIYNLKDAIGSMQVVLNKRAIGVIDAELGKRARA